MGVPTEGRTVFLGERGGSGGGFCIKSDMGGQREAWGRELAISGGRRPDRQNLPLLWGSWCPAPRFEGPAAKCQIWQGGKCDLVLGELVACPVPWQSDWRGLCWSPRFVAESHTC